jgi:TonB family protein
LGYAHWTELRRPGRVRECLEATEDSEVSSATDEKIKDGSKLGGNSEPKSRRANPVVLEVPVSVAGARPATSNEKRELFSEETTTVLVFKDGAVIQLSAAITVGQLLFLTDKRSKREVVCQVVHKRSHRPTSCYVELEFTEEVENFWGVSFPEHPETKLPPAAEAVETQETTEDDPGEPIEAPKTEDVAQLKSEVEALRAQLKALQEEKQASQEKKPDEELDEQSKKLVEAEAAARAAVEASANENAARMDREARERAERMAAKARQHLQAQRPALAPIPSEAPVEPAQTHGPAPSGVDLDAEAKAAAEEKEAARRAAQVEAEARAAMEDAAKLSQWARDEDSRKASEEARKWELEAIEAERRRKQDEQAKRERAERGEPEPEPEPNHEPEVQQGEQQKPAAVGGLKIGMKLPGAAGSSETVSETAAKGHRESLDPVEELLPKPALDFSRAPKGLDPNDPYNIYKPMRKKAGWVEIVVALVLVLALVGGGGYAWYMNKLPFYHRGPKVAAGPAAAKPALAVKPTAAANGAAASGRTNSAAGTPAATDLSASAPANVAGKEASTAAAPAEVAADPSTAANKEAPAPPAEAKTPEVASAEARAPFKKDSAAKVANGKSGKNRGKAETSSESKPKAETEVDTSDAPVLAAKLVQAVQPVYPPDAMRNYITGDVKIEATVDAKGHIGAMNILVGPAPLRQAAMEALKQYVYEPATQGGKAVASKVTVTIKFWFDP